MPTALLPHDLPPTPDYATPTGDGAVPTGELARPSYQLRELGRELGSVLVGPRRLSVEEATRRFLDVDQSRHHAVEHVLLDPVRRVCAARRLATVARDAAWVCGESPQSTPSWRSVGLPEGPVRVPRVLVAALPAGVLAPVPLVVSLQREPFEDHPVLTVSAALDHAREADAVAGSFVEDSLADNPFRGHALEVTSSADGLGVAAVELPAADAADVVLPPGLWDDVERDVVGILDRGPLLQTLGLGARRGVLLVGPPGVGKTRLVRVLASQVVGRMTVLLASPDTVRTNLRNLYAMAADLAPSLVVLDDLDLVIGTRATGAGGGALHALLDSLDGAATEDVGVATLATTNDASGIDGAALRASRFDRLVKLDLPTHEARITMLGRWLGHLAARVDRQAVADVTEGFSGADVREVVRLAVLRDGEELDTASLLAAREEMRTSADLRTGQYL